MKDLFKIHADGVCTAFTGQRDVIGDELLVDEINDDVTLDGDAVGAVGVVQEGDFHALDIDDVGNALVALLLVAVGADVRDGQ